VLRRSVQPPPPPRAAPHRPGSTAQVSPTLLCRFPDISPSAATMTPSSSSTLGQSGRVPLRIPDSGSKAPCPVSSSSLASESSHRPQPSLPGIELSISSPSSCAFPSRCRHFGGGQSAQGAHSKVHSRQFVASP
jgi:hypothetical protein